jgi:DNA-binding NtrC family response regulator
VMALRLHPWPGNVRELKNVMEHAVVMLDSQTEVGPADLPVLGEGLQLDLGGDGEEGGETPFNMGYHSARDQVLGEFERGYLQRVVTRTRGKVEDAARMAGVDPTTLYRLMDKHGLSREDLLLSAARQPQGEAL